MHDPDTLAFQIKLPLPWKVAGFLKNDPSRWKTVTLANIWHHDPARRGNDDSCGWFMRAGHGDPKVLKAISKAFEFDWDRVYKSDSGKTYYTGFFMPQDAGAGMPNMGVTAIVLNLFLLAASEHFKCDGRSQWKKSRSYLKKHLVDIMLFAENPTDSLRDSIVRKWGIEEKREDRIAHMASVIYGWILRTERPWYKHPRWHIHHWQFQIPLWQYLRRGLFDRCSICHKGFKFGESCCGSWHGTSIWHDRCSHDHPETKGATNV